MRKKHLTSSDRDGNIREMSRDKTGQIKREAENSPFVALVTAYYPKSQTIDVNRPTRFGQTVSETVIVFGDFFQATGMIQSPKIATTFDADGFSTIRKPEQKLPTSDEYVLDNNITALVFKTDFGYVTSSFRFLDKDSPMLNNSKPGRKITRHDDGSTSIHDEDGNYQFTHPSGLNIRAGSSVDDIELDEPFPPHEKNVLDYATGIIAEIKVPSAIGVIKLTLDGAGGTKLDHPTGSVFEYDAAGLLEVTSSTSENLKTIINAINGEVQKIVVANGTSPDVAALIQLQADLALVLK